MAVEEKRPVLVALRALGLGDFLTAVPALRALAAAFPEHHKALAAPRVLAPLAHLTGAVDSVLDTAPLSPVDTPPGSADVAVNLHGRGPESHRALLAARPRTLISFHNPDVSESADGPLWRPEEHEVLRWCRMLESYGILADPNNLDLPGLPLQEPAVRGATLVHPGAASPARRWPADRWSAVARAESEQGRTVMVTGGPEEIDLAREVARGAGLPESSVYAGRTGLLELAALVGAAGRVVCGDTGVAHLATAFRTPSVVLFGPTSPDLWGPLKDRPWHRVIWTGTEGDPHGKSPHSGLLEIGVPDVLSELAALPSAVADDFDERRVG